MLNNFPFLVLPFLITGEHAEEGEGWSGERKEQDVELLVFWGAAVII